MPVEKPHIPPERKAVSEFQTPSPAVVFFTELVNRTDPAYVQNAPVARGTLYSTIIGANQDVIATYPALFFVKERKLGTSDQLVLWDWATDPAAEDTYNAEVNYVSNAVPYPAFTRVYTLRRDYYERNPTLPVGSTLTGLLGVLITNTGNGYTTATGTVYGTNVAIEFQIVNGEIYAGVVTNEGTGITTDSIITINGDGDGATCLPIVQPTNCYLTSQKKQELPENDPLRNEYVRVMRTYETLPGPFIASTKLDKYDNEVTENVRRNIAANINPGATLVAGVWTQISKKGDDNFVAEEIVQTQSIPGNTITSTVFDRAGVLKTTSEQLVAFTSVITSEVLTPNVLTNKYGNAVDSLVSTQFIDVITVDSPSLLDLPSYTTSVPNLIPEEFRPFIPTITVSHIVEGTAAQPPLALGEFEHSERQLHPLYKEVRSTSLGSPTLPITHTNKETTTQFGGGDVDRNITLELTGTGTLDENQFVLDSSIKDLGNGMEIKESRILDPSSRPWPVIPSRLWDENMRVEYDETRQVVVSGTGEDSPPPGVFGFTSEVKGIDKWRSQIIDVTKSNIFNEGNPLITFDYRPFRFPGYLYRASGGYYVRSAHADLCQHKIRTWWINSSNPPALPHIDEIIMDNPIINTLNSTTTLTYAGECLHDDLLTFGQLFFPATTPSGTEYFLGTPSGMSTLQNFALLFSPGASGGYFIGEVLAITGAGHSMTITVTSVYNVPGGPTGLIAAWTNNSGDYPASSMIYGPFTASVGDAQFNVWAVNQQGYTPGTAWIGTEKVIAATVTPEREQDVWKIQTRSVVMR